jgi:hypothetical protein
MGVGFSPHHRVGKCDKEDPLVGSTRKLAQKIVKGMEMMENGDEDVSMEEAIGQLDGEIEDSSEGNTMHGLEEIGSGGDEEGNEDGVCLDKKMVEGGVLMSQVIHGLSDGFRYDQMGDEVLNQDQNGSGN